jgi:hypothetical protein
LFGTAKIEFFLYYLLKRNIFFRAVLFS